jgi:hypothetical protein
VTKPINVQFTVNPAEMKNTQLAEAVRRAIIRDQIKHAKPQRVLGLEENWAATPPPATRWQRVKAVLRRYWRIAKIRLGRTT